MCREFKREIASKVWSKVPEDLCYDISVKLTNVLQEQIWVLVAPVSSFKNMEKKYFNE
jgi:hypothetical protein